jgi:hypothetical protein
VTVGVDVLVLTEVRFSYGLIELAESRTNGGLYLGYICASWGGACTVRVVRNQFRNWLGIGSVAGGAATGNQSGSAGTSAAAGTVDHTERMMVVHIANDTRNPPHALRVVPRLD